MLRFRNISIFRDSGSNYDESVPLKILLRKYSRLTRLVQATGVPAMESYAMKFRCGNVVSGSIVGVTSSSVQYAQSTPVPAIPA